ncbi:hypothetical protein FA15DRAFT_598905 [Coprinopsis marcescibilis]|uniref:CST complex subunit STN1 n=1 Tax=Coprinopsis marcescibilis TaxID=230819 RepID=A0A5C3KY67_COPMA|nr:hypothetical protein FA15DRAFT_598905 [Coprinopsis marcescibilis]
MLTPAEGQRSSTDRQRPRASKIESKELPTHQEIFKWAVTADATASCHIGDVHEMKESSSGPDFFWLGRVPCRNVRLVGMVVGVTVYESRIIYTIDDGTGVIDCTSKVALQRADKSSPSKPSSSKLDVLSDLPEPIATVGDAVCCEGKVVLKYNERQLVASQIGKCGTFNEELRHYRNVRKLHEQHYSLREPFVIPEFKPEKSHATPSRSVVGPKQTPARFDIPSSPGTSVASSPVKSEAQRSPLKLRHPSRLRSADLRPNTFRIYLKHFMDHDPQLTQDINNDPFMAPSFNVTQHTEATPTKRPRLSRSAPKDPESRHTTPRPSQHHLSSSSSRHPTIEPFSLGRISYGGPSLAALRNMPIIDDLDAQRSQNPPPTQGYTLSYLRRVPELAFLAKRVLRQEMRNAKKVAKERQSQARTSTSKSKQPPPPSSSTSSKQRELKPTAKDVKRLFSNSLIELYHEGSIVFWTGPVRPCSELQDRANTTAMWKSNTTNRTFDGDERANTTAGFTSIFGHSRSGINISMDDVGEDDVLSEPNSNEEAYVSLKIPLLADHIADILPKVKAASRGKAETAAPYAGVELNRLVGYMRKDDQWRYVRRDSVGEALELLESEGRAYSLKKDAWDVAE